MPFYESVWKFIFRMNGICFLTDPTFAIIFRGIISEPRKKGPFTRKKHQSVNPRSPPPFRGFPIFWNAHCNAGRIDSVTHLRPSNLRHHANDKSERFERELRRGRYVGRFLIVVEGTLADVQRSARGIHPNSISGTLASWAVRFCPIIFAGSTAGAADFAFRALASQVRDIQRATQSVSSEPSAPSTLLGKKNPLQGRRAHRRPIPL